MSASSENSYREQDQFEEIEHVVTIEKKVPESNAKYSISNPSGGNKPDYKKPSQSYKRQRPSTPEFIGRGEYEQFEIPHEPIVSPFKKQESGSKYYSHTPDRDFRSVRSIPSNTVYQSRPANIKLVNSRYVPSGLGPSYSTYDSNNSGYNSSNSYNSRTYTNVTKRVIPTSTTTYSTISKPYRMEKTIESKTYSFGPKEFQTDLESSLKREKARRIVQSKYLNNQVNRPVFEQRVTPNYQTKTVSYGPPPDASYRSSDAFKKEPYESFENIVSHHAKPVETESLKGSSGMGVIGKKISKKKTKTDPKDPNVIEFSNKNGPETFTITHKTVTKKSKNQNKEKRKSSKKDPRYEKMLKENGEIKQMIKDFKSTGNNTTKLEEKLNMLYKEMENLRKENNQLNEKVWKVESELNGKTIDLGNKTSELERQNLRNDKLRSQLEEEKEEVENWKEKYQKEKEKNIFLEQENKILEETKRKLEDQLNKARQRLAQNDDRILEMSKENSALGMAKKMFEDKIRGMEKEIDRMNNMVSMTQSQMAPGNHDQKSNFLGSEHNFGMNTTFGKDPRLTEAKVIQGLNSQLSDLRNEKEEIKGKLSREKKQAKEQISNLERLKLKMEKLKNENKILKEENENLSKEQNNKFKSNLDLEKQIMQERSKFEGEEFKNKLQEEKIEKLKGQILKLQKQKNGIENEREKAEEEWEGERDNWTRERAVKDGLIKDERRKRTHLENKIHNKDDFIEKLLEMLKMPMSGYQKNSGRMGESLGSSDFLEDEKRLYKRILEEIQMKYTKDRIKDLFEIQKNMSPIGKDIKQFSMGSSPDIEIEQQIIQLKKNLESQTRELNDVKRKAGLKETELTEEIKNLNKQVDEMKMEKEKAQDKSKKYRMALREVEEKMEEEENKNSKKLYELNKNLKEREYKLKVVEHELGMKETELGEKRQLTEGLLETQRELKVDLKTKTQELTDALDDLKLKVEKLKRQAENSSQKQKIAEEEFDKQILEIEQLKKENKRMEMEKESRKMKGNAKEQELNERELELEKKKRELEAKSLALNQNADIQKLSQRLMINRQEMKDRLLTDIKKSNSVLDYLNKDPMDQEVFMNQSMANLGWEDPKSYIVMNEKFKGLVELLKNKLENLQREKERLDKKNEKYKKNSKELKEKLENTKNEVQMMETTNTLKEERISKLKEEVKELKDSNKAMVQELEESLSKRPVSARVRNYGEGDHLRNSEVMNQNTRNNFSNRADLEELRKLENEISVLKDMVNKRDYKIEQLKEVIKNNEMVYEKSIEEHNMMYTQKMQDHQNLLERLKEMADASQSFHEMIREVSEENLELKERIDAEIRKRKRIVKTLKAEILELRVQIKGLGQLFRQMDHIKSQLNIVDVDEFEDTEGEEDEQFDERRYKGEDEESMEEEGDLEDEEEYEEDEEDVEEDDMEEEDEHENEIKNSRLFRKNRSKPRR